jgi:hypothetical protein
VVAGTVHTAKCRRGCRRRSRTKHAAIVAIAIAIVAIVVLGASSTLGATDSARGPKSVESSFGRHKSRSSAGAHLKEKRQEKFFFFYLKKKTSVSK